MRVLHTEITRQALAVLTLRSCCHIVNPFKGVDHYSGSWIVKPLVTGLW